ncbi:HAD family hydrolase [Nonomuraea sp. NPDC050556]|uniref:HAD family hydrolase n=1 Tax=Nonomuraea sp. NPDC050556 TaxID=3364369 RepID=UPI0037B7F4C0
MAIRAVVFDIGGVLELTPDRGLREKWGLDGRMDHIWAAGAIGTVTEQQVHEAVAEHYGFDEEQVSALMDDIWAEYLGTANTRLIAFVRGLRPRYRTGILSNSFVGAREREQAAYGFEDLVDDIVYSHEVGMSKPDPRIYRLSCERLGVEPGEAVFIDDTPACVEGARAVGMRGILYSSVAG